jgi:hypothetical protein
MPLKSSVASRKLVNTHPLSLFQAAVFSWHSIRMFERYGKQQFHTCEKVLASKRSCKRSVWTDPFAEPQAPELHSTAFTRRALHSVFHALGRSVHCKRSYDKTANKQQKMGEQRPLLLSLSSQPWGIRREMLAGRPARRSRPHLDAESGSVCLSALCRVRGGLH